MVIECKIHLEKSSADLKPGDLVCGKVNYTIFKDTVVRGVELTLKGKGRCEFIPTGKKSNHVGKEKLLLQTINLLGERSSEDKVTLKAGTYTHEYQFLLPENIPYSYHKSSDTYVAYSLKLTFTRPSVFKANDIFIHKLCVLPIVDLKADAYAKSRTPVSVVLTKYQTNFFKKLGEFTMQVQVPKASYVPGESIQVRYEVQNSTTFELKCIRAKITKIRRYTSNGGEIEEKRYAICESLPTDSIPIGERKSLSSTLVIPLEASPSLLHCKVLAIEYVLRVKVCLPGMRHDARINVPLVIGSLQQLGEENMYYSKECLSNAKPNDHCGGPSTSKISEPPAYDPPPSYWQVMQMEDEDEQDILISSIPELFPGPSSTLTGRENTDVNLFSNKNCSSEDEGVSDDEDSKDEIKHNLIDLS